MNQQQPQSMQHNGPRAKCDQVIYEAICKACEIVVSSRVPMGGAIMSTTTSTAGSSRFNLQVPEIPGVRAILQNYRLSLHVPFRLDVYYQAAGDDRRELLERWCLEYNATNGSERFLQVEGMVTQDPIVQLRHVCKRIVLWLRTLYCYTRLLPAYRRNSPHIGFSIYTNTERLDDVTCLTQQPSAFRWQRQPSPVVSPYGELEWKVLYSTAVTTAAAAMAIPTVARPIPLPASHHTHDDSHGMAAAGNNRRLAAVGMPQSAPAHLRTHSMTNYHTTNPGEAYHQNHHQHHPSLVMPPLHPQHPTLQQHTYDPSHLLRPAQSAPRHAHHPHILQRRHTSIGVHEEKHQSANSTTPASQNTQIAEEPDRIMSGLSLAMMTLGKEEEDGVDLGSDVEDEGEVVENDGFEEASELPVGQGDHQQVAAVVEKRHAALHEIPPHWLEPQSHASSLTSNHRSGLPTAGEYGYAYNNHIPWQKIHPSSNPPVVGRSDLLSMEGNNTTNNSHYSQYPHHSRHLTSSPMTTPILASTPPSGAFLGCTPPTITGVFIPPRNSVTATPPFPTRPPGFVHDPPANWLPAPSLTVTSSTDPSRTNTATTSLQKPLNSLPLSSLDLLHSSPFQQQQSSQLQQSKAMTPFMVSSLGADSVHASNNNVWQKSTDHFHHHHHHDDDFEEPMPFAVEDVILAASSATTGGAGGLSTTPNTSSLLYASAAVASFAQKCAPHHNRLRIFDSSASQANGHSQANPDAAAGNGTDRPKDLLSSLAEQLDEFRSFQAELSESAMVAAAAAAGQSGSSESSSTPISLRS